MYWLWCNCWAQPFKV